MWVIGEATLAAVLEVLCYVFCKLHSTSINCCSSPLYSYFTEQLNLFIGAIFVGYRLEIWKILHSEDVAGHEEEEE